MHVRRGGLLISGLLMLCLEFSIGYFGFIVLVVQVPKRLPQTHCQSLKKGHLAMNSMQTRLKQLFFLCWMQSIICIPEMHLSGEANLGDRPAMMHSSCVGCKV